MSPVRVCPHGSIPRACSLCRRRRRQERRAYSDTAEYRRMLELVVETYGEACVYCGELALQGPTVGDPLVLAHVIAHADGGRFELENLRPAHRSCNARAGRGQTPGGPR